MITSARITSYPRSFMDPLPSVYVTVNEKEQFLFSFFPDEVRFSENEFIGLTICEATNLKYKKDKRYLRGR